MRFSFKTFFIALVALPMPGRVSLLEASNVLTHFKKGGDRFIVLSGLLLIIRILFDLMHGYSFESIIWLFTVISFISSIAFFNENLEARRATHSALLVWQLFAGSAVTVAFSQISLYEFLLMLAIWNILWSSNKFTILWFLVAIQASFVLADRLMLIALLISYFLSVLVSRNLKKSVLAIVIGIFALGISALSDYERLNRKNLVNETRIETQSTNKFFRIGIGARPDILPMLSLIYRNPIIGYGGNEENYRYDQLALSLNPMFPMAPEQTRERGVILHSGLLGYWVRYGLFGLLFQVALLNFAYRHFRSQEMNFPLILSLALFILSVLFEPGRNRMLMLIYLSRLFKNESPKKIPSV